MRETIRNTRTNYKKYYRNDLIGKECLTPSKYEQRKLNNEQRLIYKKKRPLR